MNADERLLTCRCGHIISLCLSAFLCGHLSAPATADDRPPNIVVILADDMGYRDISCYDGWIDTPNLDRLASEGLRFTDFHSSGVVCSPTRAGLLTGRYQQRAGIDGVVYADPERNRHHGLHTHEVTLPRILKQAGYATGIVGKWHLGYETRFNPVHHGFDLFRGYVSGNIDFISHLDGTNVPDWWDGDTRIEEEGYVTHLITEHAVRFIERRAEQPFFLYIAHEAPHYPYQGPHDPPQRVPGKANPVPRKSSEWNESRYIQMVQEMDKSVSEVMYAIRRMGLGENTYVIFFSDNGPTQTVGSAGGLRGFKGSVWEGGHRVPAIVWGPGISPGVSDETVISLDLMPTILGLAGVEPPNDHKLDGVDIRQTLLRGVAVRDRKLFWHYSGQRAMRDGDWKLVEGLTDLKGAGLYHLGDDPDEWDNRAERYPERVAVMRKALDAWYADVTRNATPQPQRK